MIQRSYSLVITHKNATYSSKTDTPNIKYIKWNTVHQQEMFNKISIAFLESHQLSKSWTHWYYLLSQIILIRNTTSFLCEIATKVTYGFKIKRLHERSVARYLQHHIRNKVKRCIAHYLSGKLACKDTPHQNSEW